MILINYTALRRVPLCPNIQIPPTTRDYHISNKGRARITLLGRSISRLAIQVSSCINIIQGSSTIPHKCKTKTCLEKRRQVTIMMMVTSLEENRVEEEPKVRSTKKIQMVTGATSRIKDKLFQALFKAFTHRWGTMSVTSNYSKVTWSLWIKDSHQWVTFPSRLIRLQKITNKDLATLNRSREAWDHRLLPQKDAIIQRRMGRIFNLFSPNKIRSRIQKKLLVIEVDLILIQGQWSERWEASQPRRLWINKNISIASWAPKW